MKFVTHLDSFPGFWESGYVNYMTKETEEAEENN